jgi:pimeloyl-CoA synthetase
VGSVSDYNEKLKELAEKIKAQQPAMAILNGMADEIKAVKLSAPKSSIGAPSKELQEAMATAKQLTEEKGVTSSAAQVAWDIVEEIAASGSGNAMGGMMTEEECLVDAAVEACEALEELSRALDKH